MQTLTAEQREHWETEGYLVLRQALDPSEIKMFFDEIDRLRQIPGYEPVRDPDLPIGHYGWLPHADNLDPGSFMDRRDLLPYGKHFVDLVDRPNVFDLIVDIMGHYICLSMTQAIVRPGVESFPGYTHTDGGEALRQIRPSEGSRPIAMKAMYLLTDTDEPDSGNLTLFPGSHRKQIPFGSPEKTVQPDWPGSKQILAKAGDCILFPHSMWHGPCVNKCGRPRRVLLYNYCQMFVRQYDFEITTALAEWCTPRQRRLLGDLGYDFRPGSYFYGPRDQVDVIEQREVA